MSKFQSIGNNSNIFVYILILSVFQVEKRGGAKEGNFQLELDGVYSIAYNDFAGSRVSRELHGTHINNDVVSSF